LAEASFKCKAFAQALLNIESHVRAKRAQLTTIDLQSIYKRIHQIYSELEISDAMEGIYSMFERPGLEEQILENESTGHWTSAQTCYEIGLQTSPQSTELRVGLVSCLKNLGHFGNDFFLEGYRSLTCV
jgi:serine/threonine-protein kinase ATR